MFDTFEAAEIWRRQRHQRVEPGTGLEQWNTSAKGRADRDRGTNTRRALEVFEYMQDGSDAWLGVSQSLERKWTTVERALNAPPMKAELGIDIDPKAGTVSFGNGDGMAGRDLLLAILTAIASPSFRFAQVETREDREVFLRQFAAQSVKGPAGGAAGPAGPPAAGSASGGTAGPASSGPVQPPTSPKAPRRGPLTNSRKTLAPRNGPRAFSVSGARLNTIYKECREVEVAGRENAAALLLRVFIELSSEHYLIEKSVALPSKHSQRTGWADFGISLKEKIEAVLGALDPQGAADPKKADKRFQNVRLAVNSHNGAASINTLHRYFHNRGLRLDAANVMAAWDDWEPYLTALYAAL